MRFPKHILFTDIKPLNQPSLCYNSPDQADWAT